MVNSDFKPSTVYCSKQKGFIPSVHIPSGSQMPQWPPTHIIWINILAETKGMSPCDDPYNCMWSNLVEWCWSHAQLKQRKLLKASSVSRVIKWTVLPCQLLEILNYDQWFSFGNEGVQLPVLHSHCSGCILHIHFY